MESQSNSEIGAYTAIFSAVKPILLDSLQNESCAVGTGVSPKQSEGMGGGTSLHRPKAHFCTAAIAIIVSWSPAELRGMGLTTVPMVRVAGGRLLRYDVSLRKAGSETTADATQDAGTRLALRGMYAPNSCYSKPRRPRIHHRNRRRAAQHCRWHRLLRRSYLDL
jgi:hypothetical protein